jgi:membrane-associated phospholipid phosphatase
MSAIQRWLLSLGVTGVAVAIVFAWIDRPLSFWAHGQFPQHETFTQFTYIPEVLEPLAIVVFVGLGLWSLSGRVLSKIQTAVLLGSVSLVMADATKNLLKYVFGRTWPETWVRNNPSLIHDGVYGFNFFHGGAGYASFPSGHTAVTCGAMSVLWIYYPQWRALYALVVAAVVAGLIGANYHFLSDIIAGGFVGCSSGWMATALWRTRQSLPQPKRRTPRRRR